MYLQNGETDERTNWQTDRKADLKQDDPSSRPKTRRMERIKLTPIFFPSDLIVFYGSQTIISFGIHQTEYIHAHVCIKKVGAIKETPGFSSWFTKKKQLQLSLRTVARMCFPSQHSDAVCTPVRDTSWWKQLQLLEDTTVKLFIQTGGSAWSCLSFLPLRFAKFVFTYFGSGLKKYRWMRHSLYSFILIHIFPL